MSDRRRPVPGTGPVLVLMARKGRAARRKTVASDTATHRAWQAWNVVQQFGCVNFFPDETDGSLPPGLRQLARFHRSAVPVGPVIQMTHSGLRQSAKSCDQNRNAQVTRHPTIYCLYMESVQATMSATDRLWDCASVIFPASSIPQPACHLQRSDRISCRPMRAAGKPPRQGSAAAPGCGLGDSEDRALHRHKLIARPKECAADPPERRRGLLRAGRVRHLTRNVARDQGEEEPLPQRQAAPSCGNAGLCGCGRHPVPALDQR